MRETESLLSKDQCLIGVGAAVAAGCRPCALSFAAAAREAGGCDRGIRISIEAGLCGRNDATEGVSKFVRETFLWPEVEATARAKKILLKALIGVASAVATNAASEIQARVDDARAAGASDIQIRVASQIAVTAKREAELQTERALSVALDPGGHSL